MIVTPLAQISVREYSLGARKRPKCSGENRRCNSCGGCEADISYLATPRSVRSHALFIMDWVPLFQEGIYMIFDPLVIRTKGHLSRNRRNGTLSFNNIEPEQMGRTGVHHDGLNVVDPNVALDTLNIFLVRLAGKVSRIVHQYSHQSEEPHFTPSSFLPFMLSIDREEQSKQQSLQSTFCFCQIQLERMINLCRLLLSAGIRSRDERTTTRC